MHATTFAHSARPPDCGISNGRPHLENGLGARQLHELLEERGDDRPNDRDLVLRSLRFHLGKHFVPWWKQRIEIAVDVWLGYKSVMAPGSDVRSGRQGTPLSISD